MGLNSSQWNVSSNACNFWRVLLKQRGVPIFTFPCLLSWNSDVLAGPPGVILVHDKNHTLRRAEQRQKEPRFLITAWFLYTSFGLPTSFYTRENKTSTLFELLLFWIFPNYFIISDAVKRNVNTDIVNHYATLFQFFIDALWLCEIIILHIIHLPNISCISTLQQALC